jgi:hypothetical protein
MNKRGSMSPLTDRQNSSRENLQQFFGFRKWKHQMKRPKLKIFTTTRSSQHEGKMPSSPLSSNRSSSLSFASALLSNRISNLSQQNTPLLEHEDSFHEEWKDRFGLESEPLPLEDYLVVDHRTPSELKMYQDLLSKQLNLPPICSICEKENTFDHRFFNCSATQLLISHVERIITKVIGIKQDLVLRDFVLFFADLRSTLFCAKKVAALAVIHSCALEAIMAAPEYSLYPPSLIVASFNTRLQARISILYAGKLELDRTPLEQVADPRTDESASVLPLSTQAHGFKLDEDGIDLAKRSPWNGGLISCTGDSRIVFSIED